MSIPKKIHSCWFGNGEKPESVKKCINSWKEKLPDYEIYEWNENNIDFKSNSYAREAYENKKWAFVTDYVRLLVLVKFGGFYFDTDVEVLRPFDDLLQYNAIVGFEEERYIMTAVLGAKANHPVFLEWLRQYDNMHFILDNNELNTTTNVKVFSDILYKHGLIPNGSRQCLSNIEVFPCDYFSPKNYYTEKICITSNSYTIHHFSKSWCKKESIIKRFLRMHPRVQYIILTPNRVGRKLLGSKYDILKRRLKNEIY